MRRASILILALALAVRTGSAQTRNDLPVSLGSLLDREYPGWSFAKAHPDFSSLLKEKGMFPNLVFGDYNQDGHRDYAVRIEYHQQAIRRAAIIAFVSEGAGFVPHVIRAYEENPAPEKSLSYSYYSYLYPQPRGTTDYDYELEKEFVFEKDAFMDVADGKGSVSYIFEDDKFRSVITGD